MAAPDTPHQAPPATIGQSIVAGLLGFGICVVCLLPPLIHFITGPLGPFLGGLIGGSRVRARGRDALVIGLTIGSTLAVVVGGAAGVVLALLPLKGSPLGNVEAIAAGALVYGSALGGLGAVIGGWRERRG
ncbi:MAG: hypothetical protein HY689_08605 [Chloroflexi bacterium]|nr:hypothetical protein [Chloroflexota bacterium]